MEKGDLESKRSGRKGDPWHAKAWGRGGRRKRKGGGHSVRKEGKIGGLPESKGERGHGGSIQRNQWWRGRHKRTNNLVAFLWKGSKEGRPEIFSEG